mgnify:CR=1
MSTWKIQRLGDQAIALSLEELTLANHRKVLAVERWFSNNRFEGLLDVIVAYSSITLLYDGYRVRMSAQQPSHTYVESVLRTAFVESAMDDVSQTSLKTIPVCYESEYALDAEWVCALKSISREELISIHTSKVYRVYAVGFLPGFPYMAEIDARIEVPRLDRPRPHVPAGSVAIAGAQTGIYPLDSPGGWRIIGRTPLTLFEKERNPPVLLEAGHEVRFEAISREHFMDIQRR